MWPFEAVQAHARVLAAGVTKPLVDRQRSRRRVEVEHEQPFARRAARARDGPPAGFVNRQPVRLLLIAERATEDTILRVARYLLL